MRKLITGLTLPVALALFLAMTPQARSMSVDDLLQLCDAGFSPDRIARIVRATGMDQPLEAADWARLKTEGCGDEVVDALLDVLAPGTEIEEAEDVAEADNSNDVNVYVHSDMGWNGWYGSLFWGPSDPWWGSRVGWYDPWWGWNTYYTNWYWSDPWWGQSFHHRYYGFAYCDPYFYHGHHYTGGYYFGGVHYRQKAMRQAGHARTYRYASLKSTPSVQTASFASAKAKPYRSGAAVRGLGESGVVAYRKSTSTSVVRTGNTTLARRKTGTYGRVTTPSTGAVKGSTPSTGTSSTYAKRKTTGASTGNVPSTGVSRGKTRVKQPTTTGGTTTAKRKPSGGATSTGTPSTGTSTGKAKPKGSSSSSYSPPKHQSSGSVSTGSSSARSGSSSGGTARPKKH